MKLEFPTPAPPPEPEVDPPRSPKWDEEWQIEVQVTVEFCGSEPLARWLGVEGYGEPGETELADSIIAWVGTSTPANVLTWMDEWEMLGTAKSSVSVEVKPTKEANNE